MKYIFSILLIALLTGCHLRAGNAAKKIGAMGKCGVSLCISTTSLVKPSQQQDAPSVISVSLLERSASILTW